jgi:hypothetical protein
MAITKEGTINKTGETLPTSHLMYSVVPLVVNKQKTTPLFGVVLFARTSCNYFFSFSQGAAFSAEQGVAQPALPSAFFAVASFFTFGFSSFDAKAGDETAAKNATIDITANNFFIILNF